jgi:hypothetical protein
MEKPILKPLRRKCRVKLGNVNGFRVIHHRNVVIGLRLRRRERGRD